LKGWTSFSVEALIGNELRGQM